MTKAELIAKIRKIAGSTTLCFDDLQAPLDTLWATAYSDGYDEGHMDGYDEGYYDGGVEANL